MDLEPPDSHYVSAASGWLELGSPNEAIAELQKVDESLEEHPEVLAIRWAILYRTEAFAESLQVAKLFTQVDPDNVQSWIDLSISLYKTGDTQSAYDTLAAKLSTFSAEWSVHYNLACYATQLDDVDAARRFLRAAFTLGNEKQLKAIALDDPDLKSLWEEIPMM